MEHHVDIINDNAMLCCDYKSIKRNNLYLLFTKPVPEQHNLVSSGTSAYVDVAHGTRWMWQSAALSVWTLITHIEYAQKYQQKKHIFNTQHHHLHPTLQQLMWMWYNV